MSFKRFMACGLFSVAVLCSAVFTPTKASAATLNVVGGRLLGASNVSVGGSLYDVEFLDGTCISLFDGCDAVTDFAFDTLTNAQAASQALLDQVFLDGEAGQFDTSPGLPSGCEYTVFQCVSIVPYSVSSGVVMLAQAYNSLSEIGDLIGALTKSAEFDTTTTEFTYAVFVPVPEPGAGVLTALGLTGLGWLGRVKRR